MYELFKTFGENLGSPQTRELPSSYLVCQLVEPWFLVTLNLL